MRYFLAFACSLLFSIASFSKENRWITDSVPKQKLKDSIVELDYKWNISLGLNELFRREVLIKTMVFTPSDIGFGVSISYRFGKDNYIYKEEVLGSRLISEVIEKDFIVKNNGNTTVNSLFLAGTIRPYISRRIFLDFEPFYRQSWTQNILLKSDFNEYQFSSSQYTWGSTISLGMSPFFIKKTSFYMDYSLGYTININHFIGEYAQYIYDENNQLLPFFFQSFSSNIVTGIPRITVRIGYIRKHKTLSGI